MCPTFIWETCDTSRCLSIIVIVPYYWHCQLWVAWDKTKDTKWRISQLQAKNFWLCWYKSICTLFKFNKDITIYLKSIVWSHLIYDSDVKTHSSALSVLLSDQLVWKFFSWPIFKFVVGGKITLMLRNSQRKGSTSKTFAKSNNLIKT